MLELSHVSVFVPVEVVPCTCALIHMLLQGRTFTGLSYIKELFLVMVYMGRLTENLKKHLTA